VIASSNKQPAVKARGGLELELGRVGMWNFCFPFAVAFGEARKQGRQAGVHVG